MRPRKNRKISCKYCTERVRDVFKTYFILHEYLFFEDPIGRHFEGILHPVVSLLAPGLVLLRDFFALELVLFDLLSGRLSFKFWDSCRLLT
jgi:hypothetical protein